MKPIATMIAACLALALQGAFASAYATNASGHCTGMTVVDYLSSDVYDFTGSTVFVNITDGHLNFTTPSTGCVMITFSGLASVSPNNNTDLYLRVRTLLDGNSLCVPALYADAFWATSVQQGQASANSITRICKNVAAGTHTVQAQYRGSSGDVVGIDGHVLTVIHN